MPKPELYPIKKLIRLDQETLDAIETFRAEQKPIPNQSEAIRKILRDYLVSYGALEPDGTT